MKTKKARRSLKPTKPGVIVQYLLDTFSTLPASSDMLNGHVLFLYVTSCDRSRALTKRELFARIPSTSQSEGNSAQILRYLDAGVKRIVADTLDKFHNPSDQNQFKEYESICQRKFSLLPQDLPPTVPTASQSTSSSSEPLIDVAHVLPLPKSPVKTRAISKCLNCKRLKHDMKLMHRKQLEMQRGKLLAIRTLRAQQKKKAAVKTLNQSVKRKSEQISRIRNQFTATNLARDLKDARLKISSIEKRHRMMKKYHQEKKVSKNFFRCEECVEWQLKFQEQSIEIVGLQTEKCLLAEQVQEMTQAHVKTTKADGKSYCPDIRMMVYDAIVDQVPTVNIPHMIEQFTRRFDITLTDVPHRSTVESMTRELGSISDLQAAEAIMGNKNITLGFDATTQEGQHVNSIHVTTEHSCYAVAVDELPGGTAQDYSAHICDSIDNLASVHAYFHDADQKESKKLMISNIVNTLTDRCAANHAAIGLVNQSWNKSLNELNCHLHPLDSVATKARSALKKCEEVIPNLSKAVFGKDCIAANIVLAMNKMRYKDGKGDPRGFITFLENENLPRGILPRYRGNRLHVLFHICGIFIQHHNTFKKFLEKGTACGGLRTSILADFRDTTGHTEMQVLGLLGKVFSGPWMRKFYRSAEDQIDHVEGIAVVKRVVQKLTVERRPLDLLTWEKDIFDDQMDSSDATLLALRQPPKDPELFTKMMQACLIAILDVLDRQYKKYFDTDVTEQLKEETKSARTHNIDAEEVMGMFSAAKKRAPNATICFLSCKMRAQKNRTVGYLDAMDKEKRNSILKKAIKLGLEQRQRRKLKQRDLRVELSRRQAEKQQSRETTERNRLENKLKTVEVNELAEKFPDLSEEKREMVAELLTGKCVGHTICHIWYEDGQKVMYSGKLEKFKAKSNKYVVAYWTQSDTYDDATDYDMTASALAADLIADDLVL